MITSWGGSHLGSIADDRASFQVIDLKGYSELLRSFNSQWRESTMKRCITRLIVVSCMFAAASCHPSNGVVKRVQNSNADSQGESRQQIGPKVLNVISAGLCLCNTLPKVICIVRIINVYRDGIICEAELINLRLISMEAGKLRLASTLINIHMNDPNGQTWCIPPFDGFIRSSKYEPTLTLPPFQSAKLKNVVGFKSKLQCVSGHGSSDLPRFVSIAFFKSIEIEQLRMTHDVLMMCIGLPTVVKLDSNIPD
jgi:hypothetical protein